MRTPRLTRFGPPTRPQAVSPPDDSHALAAAALAGLPDRPRSALVLGGRPGALGRLVPGTRIETLPSGLTGAALRGEALGVLASGAYEAVVAVDALPRVAPARRAEFLAELARISKRWVIIASEFRLTTCDLADELIAEFLDRRPCPDQRGFSRSTRQALPDRSETVGVYEDLGASWTRIVHAEHGRQAVVAGFASS